jgi:hypothetical protein
MEWDIKFKIDIDRNGRRLPAVVSELFRQSVTMTENETRRLGYIFTRSELTALLDKFSGDL